MRYFNRLNNDDEVVAPNLCEPVDRCLAEMGMKR